MSFAGVTALLAVPATSLAIATAVPLVGQDAPAARPIVWEPCPGAAGERTQCATLGLPLRHDRPDGPTMDVGIRRVLGTEPGGRQVWYLAGGPGDAVGGALGRLADLLGDPTLDFYAIDHRGTGASADLRCPAEEAPGSFEGNEIVEDEWASCIEHIVATRSDLDALTVTGAAHDLGRAVDAVAADLVASGDTAGTVFIFGASYGSYWANRYLHLYPDQPAGVLLDGVVPADWSFAEFDAGLDGTAREWLARCAADLVCGARMGADPPAVVADVLRRLDDGHCPALGIDARTARILMGVTLMVDEIPNVAIPAMALRWGRCAWHDQMALVHLFRSVGGSIGEPSTHSPVLQRHVALSELWNADDPPAASLAAALEEAVATTEVSASFAVTYPEWPRYPPDPLDGEHAPYDGPMLLLHGGLDPTMPLERLDALRAHFAGPAQTFVAIPDAGHVTINYSECARAMFGGFLAEPTAAVETSCVGEERFSGFEVDAEAIEAMFGRADLWGDDVGWLETAWYRLRFNFLPILLLAGGLFVLSRQASSEGTIGRRGTVAIGLSLAIAFGAYALVASVPLLLDYNSAAATASVIAISLLQALTFAGLARWLGRGSSPAT